MKKTIITATLMFGIMTVNAQNLGGMLRSKANDVAKKQTEKVSKSLDVKSLEKTASSSNVGGMEGKWKVDGVIVTTELEALKSQLEAQEKNYNDTYKGYNWIFKKDGSISVTAKDPNSGRVQTGEGKYELQGEKIMMEINNQPGTYDLKFEDGQMLLINTSPVNTIYYVFVKA